MRQQEYGSSSIDKLPRPVPGADSLTTAERGRIDRSGEIAGWASDAASEARPGVPRDKAPELGAETLYIDIIPPHSAKIGVPAACAASRSSRNPVLFDRVSRCNSG